MANAVPSTYTTVFYPEYSSALVAKYPTNLQVSVLYGRPTAAKNDWMNTRLRLTLTSHINLCFRPKRKNTFGTPAQLKSVNNTHFLE